MNDTMQKRGQAFLALAILMGGIILSVGTTLALVTASFVSSSGSYQASVRAEAAAEAGAQDALLQLARNNAFSSGDYSVTPGQDTATVTVTQNSPSVGFVTVLALATVFSHTRKVQVVLSMNPTTGVANVLSWGDIP